MATPTCEQRCGAVGRELLFHNAVFARKACMLVCKASGASRARAAVRWVPAQPGRARRGRRHSAGGRRCSAKGGAHGGDGGSSSRRRLSKAHKVSTMVLYVCMTEASRPCTKRPHERSPGARGGGGGARQRAAREGRVGGEARVGDMPRLICTLTSPLVSVVTGDFQCPHLFLQVAHALSQRDP